MFVGRSSLTNLIVQAAAAAKHRLRQHAPGSIQKPDPRYGPRVKANGLVALFLVSALACEPPAAQPPTRPLPQTARPTAECAPSAAPVLGASAPAAPGPTPPDRLEPAAIDAYLSRAVADKGSPGVSVAILHRGKVVFAKGYGNAVIDPPTPVGPETKFAIGSVTKQFTCASVALLAEDKKLAVDDKVSKYYPKLTRAKDITLADLGQHVSGYRDYYPLDFVDARLTKPIAPDVLIGEYAGMPLDFEPGARFSYSNTGYIILGRVVEKVSGQSFGAFMQQRLFGPAGLRETTLSAADTSQLVNGVAAVARGYDTFALGAPEPAPPEADGWLYAAGGIFSTARDLAQWDLALLEGKLLSAASWKWMTSPRTLQDGRVSSYGCGLAMSTRQGEAVVQHSGSVSGFLAYNTMLPRTQSAVVLLTNRVDVPTRALHDELVALLIKSVAPQTTLAVSGVGAKDVARQLMLALQTGRLDRTLLGPDFDAYLTPGRVEGVAARLTALGELTSVDVENTGERGGMEVASVRFTFQRGKLRAVMFRSTDGKVQQFLVTAL